MSGLPRSRSSSDPLSENSATLDEGACPQREDGSHCTCWWDANGPCCGCGHPTIPMPSDKAVLAAARVFRQMHAIPPAGYDGLPASMRISVEEQMETVLMAAYAVDAPNRNKKAA